jgi:glyoxylase I family protein
MVLELSHPVADLGLVCSDFDASLRFYRDLLGFEEVMEIHIPEEIAIGAGLAPRGFRQVRLQAGQTLIKLMEIQPTPPPRTVDFKAGVRWLTFFVDDVPGSVEKLKASGVKFMSEPVSPPDAAYIACAQAPDGILIELVQLR